MSKAVDDRVVSLEFDNKQFEKSVDETLKQLELLKKSLNFDGATTSLSAISDASKKVDLSSVSDSVDQLSDKFSTMRMVGLMALSNIVDGAMNMAKRLGSVLMAPFNQIKTGGWSRAMNIEDAKFQIEGLKASWDELYDDIDYAVSGTAYGFDAAAKAAAQLTASGIKSGDAMKGALRGISGVAAMANSSYEEISPIFTTVAGQGKLMTMQLRQLESRGINAAATLGQQLHKSEAEIRDMVTKGKIDFDTFAKAMDDAFGEHAKDANKTFTGALSNVKAALSRIGAEFATPLIHDAIPVLNSIRLMINAIKANMGGVFELFGKATNLIGTTLSSKIDTITKKIGYFKSNGLDNVNNALKILFAGVYKIIKTISTSFNAVFGKDQRATSVTGRMNSFAESIERVAKVLYPTDAALKGFGDILKAVFTVIKMVGEAIGFLVKNIGGPLFTILIKVLATSLTLIGKLGTLVSTVVDVIKNLTSFDGIVKALADHGISLGDKTERLRAIYDRLKDVLEKVGSVAKTAFKYIAIGIAALVATPIYLIYDGFKKLTQVDWSRFRLGISNAIKLLVELFNKFKNLEIVQKVLYGIQTAFTAIVGGIIYLGSVIGDFFNRLANGEVTLDTIKEKLQNIPETLKEVGAKIATFFSSNSFFGGIGKGLGVIGTKISEFIIGIRKALSDLTPAKVMLIAFSASMIVLSINANRLSSSFIKMFDTTKESLESLTKYFTKQKTPLDKFKEAVLTTVTAIGALTIAFVVLSKIPNLKETAVTLGVFVASMATIGILVGVLDKVLKLDKGFKEFSQNMALLSLGVAAAAGALWIMSKVPMEDIWQKVGVLTVVIAELGAASIAMAKWGPSGLKGLLGMIGFAIALLAAGKALKNLDQVDFQKIKGSWKEIAAVLLGVSLFAKAISSVGISVFTGAIAFMIAFKMITSKMEDIAKKSAEGSGKTVTLTELAKQAVEKTISNIKEIIAGIWDGLKELKWYEKAFAAVIAGGLLFTLFKFITFFITKLAPGILELAKNGKHIKKAAMSFLIVAGAIAGLTLIAKYIAEAIQENPNLLKDIGVIELFMAGLLVVTGIFMSFSENANAGAIKAMRKMFTSMALVILSMAAFIAIAGDLSAHQFNRANRALQAALKTIGAFVAISSLISVFSKGAKAGFGTFAGITLLFAAIMGSLAMLMLVLKTPEDYAKLAVAFLAVNGVIISMCALMTAISKIKYKATPKTLLTMIGGLIAIGTAIAVLARVLPDNNYIGKVVTITASMLVVMSALVALMGVIQHFSKSTKFSLTKTSQKTITEALKVLGVLVGAFAAIAISISLLKDMDPGQVAASAGTITLVLVAITGMALAIDNFAKKGKHLKDAGEILAILGSLTLIFIALGVTIGKVTEMGQSASRMLAVSQTISLVIAELTTMAILLSKLTTQSTTALASLPTLFALLAVYAAIGLVIGVATQIGQKADRMLAVSQVIILCVAELIGLTVALGALVEAAGIGAVGIAGIPALIGLTAVFAVLAIAMTAVASIDTTADKLLAKSQVIMLCILELTVISVALGALVMAAGIGALGALAIPVMYGLAKVFEVLGYTIAIIATIPISDKEIQNKIDLITGVLWSMVGMMAVLGMVSTGAIGMAVGVAGIAAMIMELSMLISVLKSLETVDTTAVSNGLNAVAQALNLLATMAAGAALLAPGILTLSVGIVALGIACLAAGAGVKLFADGIASLASTTPAQLNQMIVMVKSFFTVLGQGVAAGLQAIIQTVIDGLTALRLAAVNIARGFVPDLIQALFSGSSSAAGAAKASGALVSQAWVDGFRIPVGWHSPPAIILKFFQDTIAAVTKQGVPLGQAMATNGKIAAQAFADEFSGYDLSSITQGTGLSAISGITAGVDAGQPALMAEINETLAMLGLLDNATISHGNTMDDFEYQLRTQHSANMRRLSELKKGRDAYGSTLSVTSDMIKEQEAKVAESGKRLTDYQKSAAGASKANLDLAETFKDLGSAAGGAGGGVKDLQSTLQSTLESQMNIFQKFEQKSAMSKEELLNNMRSQIEGMTNWAAQMQQLAVSGIDKGLYQKLAEMGPQGAEYVGAFASMTTEELQQANLMWAQSLVLPGQVASQLTTSWAGISGNMVNGLSAGWTAADGTFIANVTATSDEAQAAWRELNGIHSPSSVYMEFGQYMIEGLSQGMKNLEHLPVNILREIGAKMLSTAREVMASSKYYPIGAGIAEGITAGIDSRKGSIMSSLQEIADKAESTLRKALEVNSPSKRMIPIGEGISEGLAVGVDKGYSTLSDSLYTLSDKTVDTMKVTIANISAMVADGIEDPVITPILDLSNVQAGARTLNSVFSSNHAMGARASFENLQNGEYSGSGNIIFNQVNNSPKALSRIEIYRDTRNLFAQARGALS